MVINKSIINESFRRLFLLLPFFLIPRSRFTRMVSLTKPPLETCKNKIKWWLKSLACRLRRHHTNMSESLEWIWLLDSLVWAIFSVAYFIREITRWYSLFVLSQSFSGWSRISRLMIYSHCCCLVAAFCQESLNLELPGITSFYPCIIFAQTRFECIALCYLFFHSILSDFWAISHVFMIICTLNHFFSYSWSNYILLSSSWFLPLIYIPSMVSIPRVHCFRYLEFRISNILIKLNIK